MAKSNSWKNLDLQWQILIGIGAGIVLGMILNQTIPSAVSEGPIAALKTVFQLGGELFIRLLQMLIIPLVFASIFMSIVNLGNIRELKQIGLTTVVYYLVTTALAVLIGIIIVNLIHPGRGFDPDTISALKTTMGVPEHVVREGVGQRSSLIIILETFIHMIPTNPVKAMVESDILQVIFFYYFYRYYHRFVRQIFRTVYPGCRECGSDYDTIDSCHYENCTVLYFSSCHHADDRSGFPGDYGTE